MTLEELWNKTNVFVIDIDGTFRHGMELAEGAVELLEFFRRNGKKYLFFTNNSSRAPQTYVHEFALKHCFVARDEIMSTADVAVYYLNKYFKEKNVYVVGTEDFCNYLSAHGISISEDNVAAVIVSFDTTFSYEKMCRASSYIRKGAVFLATHLDKNCPVKGGMIPDCGSICASIECSTGIHPISLGKPTEISLETIINTTHTKPEAITFVGDRLSTDIAIGYYHGANTCIVLGGANSLEDISKSEINPDYIFTSLQDVLCQLQKVSGEDYSQEQGSMTLQTELLPEAL